MPPAHELSPAQSTMQAMPIGQTTGLVHALAVVQLITHVLPAHDEHALGQTKASGSIELSITGASGAPVDTHQPLSQTRPVGHAPLSQRNASERVSIEQLVASAYAASAITAARITRRLRRRRRRDPARPTA